MNENEVSSIFTLERKGSLDRDISVVTAVSAEYLNSLLADIVHARNEASALYAHISEQNYDLSVDGMLNMSETIRQLYDNLASLKNHMLRNDQEMQQRIDKACNYLYSTYVNFNGEQLSGYDLIGKTDQLLNLQTNSEAGKIEKQVSYQIKNVDNTPLVTNIPLIGSPDVTYQLSNVFLSVESEPNCAKEIIIFSGALEGNSGSDIYIETYTDRGGRKMMYDNVGSISKTYWLPASKDYSEDTKSRYIFGSVQNNAWFQSAVIKHDVKAIDSVLIGKDKQPQSEKISVMLSAYPSNWGYTEGNGVYDISSYVKIAAKPYAGYAFDHWAIKGYPISAYQNLSSDSYRVRANVANNHIAVFKKIEKPSLNISANVNHDGYGKIYVCDLSGSPYLVNETSQVKTISVDGDHYEILLKSEPKTGYKFVKWHVFYPELNGQIQTYTTDFLRWDMSTGNRKFTAEFAPRFIWRLDGICGYDRMIEWQKAAISKGYEVLKLSDNNVPTYPTRINLAYVKRELDGSYSCYHAINA